MTVLTEIPAAPFVPPDDEVLFAALGGVGEIGMNVALYGHAGRWLMVDLGVTFGDDTTPGVDLILPDLRFIEAQGDRLVGIVITHAHEDHVGAVPFFARTFGCPVYTTAFTAAFLRRKLAENGAAGEMKIVEVPLGGSFNVGPFALELVTLTHSIPEPNGLVIRTPVGTLLHTGDWKIDAEPGVGGPPDTEKLAALGASGVLAMVCDSTNAAIDTPTRSESELPESLGRLIAECPGRVVFTCFASNIARIQSIAAAAGANGRRVALVGRSLLRMNEVARETGYLKDTPPFLSEEHVGFLPRDEVVLMCTGSQGEPKAALSRIAFGSHPNVVLDPGDTVVYSSRTIPGNERSVDRVQDRLVHMGLEIVTNRDRLVHVSGHPSRPELKQMYGWVKPRFVVPVHGELRHLHAHAQLARTCGVEEALLVDNGILLAFSAKGARRLGRVPTGRLTPDGRNLSRLDGEALRARRRMSVNGSAMISLVVGRDGALLAEPQISARGLSEEIEDGRLQEAMADIVERAVAALPPGRRQDDEAIRDAARSALRRTLRNRYDKRPIVEVHVMRLGR
ncbi:MAG: ribonuclease J [Alphaproteobacteria bacterium]